MDKNDGSFEESSSLKEKNSSYELVQIGEDVINGKRRRSDITGISLGEYVFVIVFYIFILYFTE